MNRESTTPELPDPVRMYRALVERDPSFLGVFLACVRTTGIFCLPTCGARKPKRENVAFVATVGDALRDGYRPCKVCRPLTPAGEHPDWARALLEEVAAATEPRLGDADLRARGVDPARVRRYFQRTFGVTFHGYQRARRMGEAIAGLRRGASATESALTGGFDSSSGFRDAWHRMFGAAPTRTRRADALVADRVASPLGPLLVVASRRGLALLEFLDRRMLETQIATLRRRFDEPILPGRNAHLERVEDELSRYFRGELRSFEVTLDVPGTPFQESVWRRLREIPCGQITTYAAIARALGRPDATRAVGRANGDNRVAIVIPCHRVVGSDGRLTGYGGGVWRKKRLLELESRSREGLPCRA